MLKEIKKSMKKRMLECTSSRQPTSDEVMIAWLIEEINKLNKVHTMAKCCCVCGLQLAEHNSDATTSGPFTLVEPNKFSCKRCSIDSDKTGVLLDMSIIGKPIYIPATTESTTQKCFIRMCAKANSEKGITITAEGKLADICACHLSEDRRVDCVYTLRSCSTKLELILKEIVLGPGQNISINTKTKKYTGGDKFGHAKVAHDDETPGIDKIMGHIGAIMEKC